MDRFTDSKHALWRREFPRSNKYNPAWLFEHQMGPHPLWLAEWLVSSMHLTSGMRVLDLGCGTALTSIFLADAFDVEVWAADLWVDASENWDRIEKAGLQKRVFPIHAEAHQLPFAKSFFDAIVSIDSFHYFGTDQMYMGYLQRFLRPTCEIGVAVPGLHQSFEDGVPAHLREPQGTGFAFWQWDCCTFHPADWWKHLWSGYPFLEVRQAESLTNGGQLWLQWEKALDQWGGEKRFPPDIEALETDADRYITFTKIVGQITPDRDEQTIGEMINDS